jgi:hypothetical protein
MIFRLEIEDRPERQWVNVSSEQGELWSHPLPKTTPWNALDDAEHFFFLGLADLLTKEDST